jgi:hypothetical protein
MKKFVLLSVLFFGIVKPKAQEPSTSLATSNESAILLNTSSENCYWNSSSLFSKPQPIQLLRFHGKMNKSRITLEWTVSRNEQANLFEVEKSSNGKDFATTGLVFCSEKEGTEQYAFFEKAPRKNKMFYRLKLIDKSRSVDYSDVLSLDVIEKVKS